MLKNSSCKKSFNLTCLKGHIELVLLLCSGNMSINMIMAILSLNVLC